VSTIGCNALFAVASSWSRGVTTWVRAAYRWKGSMWQCRLQHDRRLFRIATGGGGASRL